MKDSGCVVLLVVAALCVAAGIYLACHGWIWWIAAVLPATLSGGAVAALCNEERGSAAVAGTFFMGFSAFFVFVLMGVFGCTDKPFIYIFWLFLIADIILLGALKGIVDKEEAKEQEKKECEKQEEERKKQEEKRREKEMKQYVKSLCSGILLPDTCFLIDLREVFFPVRDHNVFFPDPDYQEKASGRIRLAKDFFSLFEEYCQKHSFKVTLHRHVYQEIQRLYNGEDREKSKKAQGAKKMIERWQKLGIIQTYPDLEDKEKSYYADDALLKYMEELQQKGKKVRLLTNDLDLRIRARDRFEKLGKALPEDMLLSLDDILAKWPR